MASTNRQCVITFSNQHSTEPSTFEKETDNESHN